MILGLLLIRAVLVLVLVLVLVVHELLGLHGRSYQVREAALLLDRS